jgi:hypothetical protein
LRIDRSSLDVADRGPDNHRMRWCLDSRIGGDFLHLQLALEPGTTGIYVRAVFTAAPD